MTAGEGREEQRFIAGADGIEIRSRDLEPAMRWLEDWQARLSRRLLAAPLTHEGLRIDSRLAQQLRAFQQELYETVRDWPRRRAELIAAQRLADAFDGKVLLLVFGKFNAGKSSLCNFLAGRFAAQGRTVRHFHVAQGWMAESAEPLQEGATETTARLQGVQLGRNLVLLDTPGLHSMTPENAALTRRFTDSADGVLWLTSSASPGQVQELDDLARELRRGKPLLPILTRSDSYEEDEIEGEIVKRLCNKTAATRALQEADVAARARQKLSTLGVAPALLEPPVSISVHAARCGGPGAAALAEAGFERLYAALSAMIEPVLDHKQGKPAAMLLHHLEERVVADAGQHLLPRLAELRQAAAQAVERLEGQGEAFADGVWRSVIPRLPALLDSHRADGDVAAVGDAAAAWLEEAMARAKDEVFGELEGTVEPPGAPFTLEAGAAYERVAGLVDATRLRTALEHALRQRLLQAAADLTERARLAVGQLDRQAASLQTLLAASARELREDVPGAPPSPTPLA